MRCLVIGGTGTLGRAVVKELEKLHHEVITAGRQSGDVRVEMTSKSSIEKMYEEVGPLDAVVSTAGGGVPFKTFEKMTLQDYQLAIEGKLLSQIQLVLLGHSSLKEHGSFTLTSGVLNRSLIPKGSAIALVNSGLEGFVQSAALELPKKLRLNIVSPNLLEESRDQYGNLLQGFDTIPAQKAALAYVRSILGILNGQILKV